MSWKKIYKSGFTIDRSRPNSLVKKVFEKIKGEKRVLDVGCGEGRNTFYVANLGHIVDSIDTENLLGRIDDKIASNIQFHQTSFEDFQISKLYDIVILARLIQYFDFEGVKFLFDKSHDALTESGLMLIGYVTKGGMPSDILGIPKFYHHQDKVVKTLENMGMKIRDIGRIETATQYKDKSYPLEAYNIVAEK